MSKHSYETTCVNILENVAPAERFIDMTCRVCVCFFCGAGVGGQYKYKEAYRKQKGHHIGALTLEGDLKLANLMKVAKIQSEQEYKKAYEKDKTCMHLPLDMLDFVLVKKCQHQLSDVNYKNVPHDWTCLPDNISNVHARIASELQSNVSLICVVSSYFP